MFTWRIGSTIEYWNEAAERLYGYSACEACGKVSHELLKTYGSTGIASLTVALKESKQWTGELTHRTKSGNVLVVESRMMVVEDMTADRARVQPGHNGTEGGGSGPSQ